MGSMDEILVNLCADIGAEATGEFNGDIKDLMTLDQAKQQIKELFKEIVEECFEDNKGYIDDKLRAAIEAL